jgi:hypothetical protein
VRIQGKSGPAIAAALLAVVAAAGCARSTQNLAAPLVPTTTSAEVTAGASAGSGVGSDDPTGSSSPGSVVVAVPSEPAGTPPPSAESPISVVEVEEIGVPGLDSDDAFCASWSRFAGSFQVVAVNAAFGSGPPEQLAALEVAAAPTVTSAYRDLVANWPVELSSEASLVADEFLGPFARRLADADAALIAVGADDATVATISDAWIAGLARRDPSTPEFAVDLTDEVWSTIDEAATLFSARRVPFGSDPSLVTNVRTPLTEEYLAVSCPDQGSLAGQEVDAP